MSNILYIIAIICAIFVIYDVWAVQKKMAAFTKVIWTVFALLFSIITAIIYYFMVKK
ncbi:MAG: hypothetical protein R8G66_16640 [Cytophagales bacterium]|nr:hypothetical protein [Cytophagales bacterium]